MAKNDNLGDLLTSVADAIRTKKGTTAPINAQDFDTEILSIETGGGEKINHTQTSHIDENGIWHRPEEWDDIESIDIPKGKSELYLLYGNHINGHSFCRLRVYGSGTIKWARGHVVDGVFVNSTADATLSSGGYITIDLEQLEDDYSVIRITATTSITQCLPQAWNGTDAAYAATLNTMLMRYGRMPKGSNIVTANYYIESDNVMDFASALGSSALTLASAYSGCTNLKRWRHTGWNIKGNTTTSLANFLYRCTSLTDVDDLNFDGWCSSKTTTVTYFLYQCCSVGKPISVKNWNVSAVTTFAYTFAGCGLVPRIDGFETWTEAPKCTTIEYMLASMYSLSQDVDLSALRLGNGTAVFKTMTGAFSGAMTSLNISGWNLSGVTGMSTAFSSMRCCAKIIMNDIVPPSSVTTCAQLFYYNPVLEELVFDGWDFSHCTSFTTGPFYQFAYYCYNLRRLEFKNCKFQTGTAADSSSAYGNYCYGNVSLRYVDVSDMDFSIFTSTYMHSRAFYGMTCCVDFFPPKNISKSFSLSGATLLSHDSLLRVFNNLVEVSSATLTIGSINKAKMTADELAIATDKGWTIA